MIEEQQELNDRIENLNCTVGTFFNFNNVKDCETIAQTVADVNKCLN